MEITILPTEFWEEEMKMAVDVQICAGKAIEGRSGKDTEKDITKATKAVYAPAMESL